MKHIGGILLVIAIFSFVTLSCLAQDIIIEPAETVIQFTAGESTSGEIAITNNTDIDMEVQILVENWANERNGMDVWGLASWITIEPSTVQLPAGGQIRITYIVSLSDNMKGPHWAGLNFVRVSRTIEGELVFQPVATSCIKQIDPQYLVRGAMLTGIGFATSDNGQFVILAVQKTGTDFDKYTAKITILPQSGESIPPIAVPEFEILPFHSGQILAPLDGQLLPGIYQIVVEVFVDKELIISGAWHLIKTE